MFNLLMSGGGWAANRDTFPATRVLEYTPETLRTKFRPDGRFDLEAAIALPTLFASETRFDDAQEPARVGRLLRVTPQGRGDYLLDYIFDAHIPAITNATLEELARDLGIDRFEFSRTHWAIKEADLFEVLYRSQLSTRPQPKVFRFIEASADPSLVAVMMPFSAEFNEVYETLRQAAISSGMQCKRADDIWSNDHIIQDIVDLISRASVVVCDLTGRNPNVFYEMGMAHTIGKEVIIITQTPHDVPFDVQGIRYIKYHPNGEGLNKLGADVAGRIETLKQRR